ncbi:MAG: hypothetical protein ACRC3J_05730 [Culicoidibacterales bacterium]
MIYVNHGTVIESPYSTQMNAYSEFVINRQHNCFEKVPRDFYNSDELRTFKLAFASVDAALKAIKKYYEFHGYGTYNYLTYPRTDVIAHAIDYFLNQLGISK